MASEISGNSPGSQAVFLANNKETPKFHITGFRERNSLHYDDVRMGAIASQITSLAIVYSAF